MGSITEVFSHDEIIRLRTPFDGRSEIEPLRYAGNKLIRATENTNGDMVIIDPANPSTIDIIATLSEWNKKRLLFCRRRFKF